MDSETEPDVTPALVLDGLAIPADSLRQAITTASPPSSAPPSDSPRRPEAAQILGVSEQAIRQRLASGSLIGDREGRDWRILRTALKPPARKM